MLDIVVDCELNLAPERRRNFHDWRLIGHKDRRAVPIQLRLWQIAGVFQTVFLSLLNASLTAGVHVHIAENMRSQLAFRVMAE